MNAGFKRIGAPFGSYSLTFCTKLVTKAIIRERTKAGLTVARARGRQGGRPKGLSKQALSKAQAAKTLYLQQDKTVAKIGQLLGVGRATIYRYLAHLAVPTGGSMGAVPGT